ELGAVAAAHAVDVGAERPLDIRRVELADPARHGNADERDADASVVAARQHALERAGGSTVDAVATEPLPRLAEAEQGYRVRPRPVVVGRSGRGGLDECRHAEVRRLNPGDPGEQLAAIEVNRGEARG